MAELSSKPHIHIDPRIVVLVLSETFVILCNRSLKSS